MRNVLWLLGSALLATHACGVAAAQEPALFGDPFPLSRVASTSGGSDFRPDLKTDGQGNWVAVWHGWDSLGGTIGGDNDILVARSTDDGATWTPPAAVNTNAGGDSGHDYHPKVATDGQGTWIAVWYSFDSLAGSIGTDADVLVARSTDGGATWTAPAALNTNAGGDSGDDIEPQLTTDGQGNWVAVWQSNDNLEGTIGGDEDILVARSTNGGATWTPPAALRDSGSPDLLPQLATDGQGSWVAVFERESSGSDDDIRVARSTDAGATWSSTSRLHSSNDEWDWYPHVTTDGMGNWVAVWSSIKAGGSDSDIRVARSTDAGANWTSSDLLHPSNAGDDWRAKVTTDGQGNWVATWYSYDTLGGTIGADRDTLVVRSTDAGANWSTPAPLNTNAGSDAGDDRYPHVTSDGQGTWLAVWHSDDSLRGTIGRDDDILVAGSTDAGANWSAPTALNTNAYAGSGDDFAPQVATDGQGTWVAVWDSFDSLDGSTGTDGDILVTHSTDGYTWSEPAALDPNAGSDAEDDVFPQVATDGQGTWVTVWHSFDALGGTIGTDGDILVSHSTDGGVTWSAAAALDPNAGSDSGDDLFPQITTDGQGTWVAAWDSDDALGGPIGTDGDILVAASTDGGVTWSAAAALDPNADSDTGNDLTPQVTTDGSGTWVAVWHSFDTLGGTVGTDGDILVSRSTNGGVAWSAAAALDPNADSDSEDDLFAQVTTDGQGTWLAVWHSFDTLGGTIGTDGDILVSRSTDGGVMWSAAAALVPDSDSDTGDDLFPRLTTDGQGTWIAVWDSDDELGSSIGTDSDILAARSTDDGVTWTNPAALNPNAGGDAGDDFSPQLATDGQGSWVAVWESSDTLAGTISPDKDVLAAVLDPGIYQDTNSSSSFDPGEERAGGVGGNGGSIFDYVFDLDASTHDLSLTSIELVMETYNHAFRIDINGTTVVPLDPGNPAVFTPAIDDPQNANENGLPNLRVAITEVSIEFSGSETASATSITTPVLYNQPTTPPVFVDGQNTVRIENPDGRRNDGIDFRIRLRRGEIPYQKISGTQGGFTGGNPNQRNFALWLASLGDVDGDGVGDLASFGRQGFWILFLNADGTAKAHQRISATEGGFTGVDGPGNSVTSLGDLDGDGVIDLATGAFADDDGGPDRGAVWILFLNPNGTVKAQQKISSSEGGFGGTLSDGDFFGEAVASLGDLDGDGVTDLAVGARQDDDGGPNRGAVWILFLNSDGTVKSHQKISSTQGGFIGALGDADLFADTVTPLGDLDGDGVGDLAVGASQDDDGGTNRGAVWILFLDSDGTVKTHQKISDTQGGFTGGLDDADAFGLGLASLGDLDGDGEGDLAVAAFRDDDGGPDRGATWILYLDTDGTVKSHRKISSTQGDFTGTLEDGDLFGTNVASLGDLSGNGGVGDLAVNAWGDDDGGPGHGAVWILFLDGAFCSDAIRNGEEQCDDGNLVGGDGCDHVCRIEVQDSWEFNGTAAGGTVSLSVEGVPLQVLTFAGETAAGVAANIADAINADPALSAMGVVAYANENTVITNGMITDRLIKDPGLNPPAVPALAGSRLALLAALLGITATMEMRSRARARA